MNVDDLEDPIKPYVERVNKEYRIHVSIIDHITGRIRKGKEWLRGSVPFRGVFITHVFQGRSKDEGHYLKSLGVVPGVADLLSIWRNPHWKTIEEIQKQYPHINIPIYEIGFIEVKSDVGTLGKSDSPQRKFKGFCLSLKINWGLARTKRQAHDLFVKWGLTALHQPGPEADLRSDQEKFKDASAALYSR